MSKRDKIRPLILWRHYYANTSAIIFVVDSNDKERLCDDNNDEYSSQFSNTAKEEMKFIFVIVLVALPQYWQSV